MSSPPFRQKPQTQQMQSPNYFNDEVVQVGRGDITEFPEPGRAEQTKK